MLLFFHYLHLLEVRCYFSYASATTFGIASHISVHALKFHVEKDLDADIISRHSPMFSKHMKILHALYHAGHILDVIFWTPKYEITHFLLTILCFTLGLIRVFVFSVLVDHRTSSFGIFLLIFVILFSVVFFLELIGNFFRNTACFLQSLIPIFCYLFDASPSFEDEAAHSKKHKQ